MAKEAVGEAPTGEEAPTESANEGGAAAEASDFAWMRRQIAEDRALLDQPKDVP